jgi:hypothetical protein
MQSRNRLIAFSILTISAVALGTFALALRVGFVWDDWWFINFLVRLSFPEFAIQFFDPRVQIIWYRPIYGLLWGIEYIFFGTEPTGYHLVNVLLHAANCVLFFLLVQRGAGNLRVALIAALVYAGLPALSEAVLWPADAQPLTTLFYLLTIWFWWSHLETSRRWNYVAALAFFVLAIFSKETSITLPVMLFLVEWLLVRKRFPAWKDLLRTYSPLVLIVLLYLATMYRALTYGVFPSQIGYAPGAHSVSGFLQYLVLGAFPWNVAPPFPLLWLCIIALAFVWFAWRRKNRAAFFLILAAALVILPLLPQPAIKARYVYMSAMVTAIVIAWLIERAHGAFRKKWFAVAAAMTIALLVLGNGLAAAEASLDRAELSRVERVPFRTIAQRHPQFPEDTYLYFINRWTVYDSVMFLVRYGTSVTVSDVYAPRIADLRAHRNPMVIYFDEQREPRELEVDRDPRAQKIFSPPIQLESSIQLIGYELASMRVRRGEPLALILYWKATQKIERDYTVFAHLVDADGNIVEGKDSQPRGGAAPTSAWIPNDLNADGILIPIPRALPIGNRYRVEIGMYYLPTLQRLAILDERGQPRGDHLVIEPISVGE